MRTITPLPITDEEYRNIISNFNISPTFYTIHSILKIEMDWSFTNRFDSFMMWAWEKPNLLRLFHGTKHACDIWNLDDWSKLCNNSECGVCGILKFGPLLSKAQPNLAGTYLWYSPTVSMAHEYTGPLKLNDDGFRAMFVMDVIHGKPYSNSIVIEAQENALPRYLIIYKVYREKFENQEDILS
ncbi:19710_t:CDS:2 [Funneliformis geosporum]|uniref:2559_t:CDS:1 n=1 Tax=Funneliformis geosporum TaxID=1117311 RepID=A0A9W4T4D0_9GLOM|nr:2559_t:CDS:2 [Funneliformis geosporum]CAI2192128.1 19710_t:CDS:2 [Funneliformis geosporum]